MLEKILEDIINSSHKSSIKPILVPKKTINAIKNKMVDIDEIPRVILSKTSVFAHLIHNKQIDMKILIRDLNKIFS